jgi:molecular chaperone DnaK
VPQVEVTFDIDANGIVNVSAKDLGTGKEQKITITASSGLSKDEVERMMKDAESHAEDDKRRKEEIETRNRADQTVYAAEKMLQDMGAKLSSTDKAAVETAIEQLKSAVSSNDTAAMNRAMEQLTQAQHRAAEALYKNAGGAAGSAGSEGSAGAEGAGSAGSQGSGSDAAQGDVIDAEVVDEEKK